LTINTPFEVWQDSITGKANRTQMLMEGKYQIEGNGDLLIIEWQLIYYPLPPVKAPL